VGGLWSSKHEREALRTECNRTMYIPSFDQAAAKAAKMPSSRANTAVDLMAVGSEGSTVQIQVMTDRALYKRWESAVACAP
jgi:hypothetical protein